MKKLGIIGSSLALLLSTGLGFSSAAHAAENNNQIAPKISQNNKIAKENRAIDISSLPQQNFESFLQSGQVPFSSVAPIQEPNYVYPTEGSFNWTFKGTSYGNNVFYNSSYSYLVGAVTAGLSGSILALITSKFASGVAGYILGSVSLPKPTNYWWTIKKWEDKDAYNVYVKYDIKIYSDSSRSKLVDSYSEQFAERYR
ncbi:hypothetical protein [Bacillus rhizoplanae]|uniref:hypothetical protein n=1 Tax=Bacillus rhizoplanae TaxID=2880966 RepID=UPI003D22D45E